MFRSRPSALFPLVAALLFLAAGSARAQWVVYDFRIAPVVEVSENFSPYTGLYVIAPVNGGQASMIFLTEEGGRFYNVAENGGRYFTAASATGRLAAFNAVAVTGTARAMYQAVGLLNSTLASTVKGERQVGRASTDMLGTMLAADDESLAVVPGSDGSIGMVGTANLKGELRLDLSRILNQKELSMTQAVESITSLLEKYGYQFDKPDLTPTATASAPIEQSGADQPAEPEPTAPAADPDTSTLFPPGSREELERNLNQPLSK